MNPSSGLRGRASCACPSRAFGLPGPARVSPRPLEGFIPLPRSHSEETHTLSEAQDPALPPPSVAALAWIPFSFQSWRLCYPRSSGPKMAAESGVFASWRGCALLWDETSGGRGIMTPTGLRDTHAGPGWPRPPSGRKGMGRASAGGASLQASGRHYPSPS
jgi:hypothetical protein